MGNASVLYPTEERREEVLNDFVVQLGEIDAKVTEINNLQELIPQLPLVDLGALAVQLEAYEMAVNALVTTLDNVTNSIQATIVQKAAALDALEASTNE